MKNKIIIALSALVASMAGYLFYKSTNGEMSQAEVKTEFMNLKSDYEFMQSDLEETVKNLAASNKKILEQKTEIETILKKNAITEEELMVAKKLMGEISQSVLQEYNKRIAHLEKDKNQLKNQLDQNNKQKSQEFQQMASKIKILENQNKTITEKYNKEKIDSERKDNLLKYASKLSISNFILKGYKVRNSGREVETDRASRINKIDMSFDINENILTESAIKELYLVVYKPDNSLAIFSNKTSGTFSIDQTEKPYSEKIYVDYQKGKTKTISSQWESNDFQKGNYVLEVFEKTPTGIQLIGKATKELD